MAQSLKLKQGVTFSIPEDGEVFRDTSGLTNSIYKRVGNQIIVLNDGSFQRDPALMAKYGYNQYTPVNLAGILEKEGISVGSLAKYNIGDLGSAFSQLYGANPNTLFTGSTDLEAFRPKPITPTNEVFTQTLRPDNPHSGVITSDKSGVVNPGVALPLGGNPNVPGTAAQTGNIAPAPNYNAKAFDLYEFNRQMVNAPSQEPLGAINSSALSGGTPKRFSSPSTPTYTSAATVTSADTTKLSDAEIRIQGLIKDASILQERGVGRTAYAAELGKTEGMDALVKAQDDISEQILMLQAEEKNLDAKMQNNAEGRGITDAGLSPLTSAKRREIGIQANLLSAQLLATQGKISSAQKRIDKAVSEKFGPIEEELKAKLANLNLLLNDPAISVAEKSRANAQALLVNQQQAELAATKQAAGDIWKISTDAAVNVANFQPTAQYPTAAVALSAIQNAATREEALAIAAATGLTKTQTAQSDFEQAFLRENGRPPTVQELMDYEVRKSRVGGEPENSTGASYNTRLNQEISAVYAGKYNREKAIEVLKKEFPGLDVGRDIYNRIPDGYEKNIKGADVLGFDDL